VCFRGPQVTQIGLIFLFMTHLTAMSLAQTVREDIEGSGRVWYEVLPRHFPGGTEEN
jgi:hypothetical protein